MTEDEAKTKWCPFVRMTAHNGEWKTNRGDFPAGALACTANECMAWRWLPLMADDAFKAAVIKAATEIGDTSNGRHKASQHVIANRAAYGLPTQPFDGYCGLAGAP